MMQQSVQKRARGSVEIPIAQAVYFHTSKLGDINENKMISAIKSPTATVESSESDVSDLEENTNNSSKEKIKVKPVIKSKIIAQKESILAQLQLRKDINSRKRNINGKLIKSKMDRSRRRSLNGVKIKSALELTTDSITIIQHKFRYKPFGFSVAPDEFEMNAVVTKVTTKEAIAAGIHVGFVICKIKSKIVIDMPHSNILKWIMQTKLPTTLSFADRGHEYDVKFEKKPLGYSIMKDENNRNAKVCRIACEKARKAGVKMDSFLMSVNGKNTWGIMHTDIVSIIRNQKLPIVCHFRMCTSLKKT